MKKIMFALFMLLSQGSSAEILEYEFSHLEGEMVTADLYDIVGFGVGESPFNKFTQMEIFLDFTEVNVNNPRYLDFRIFGEFVDALRINERTKSAKGFLDYGSTPINPGDVFGEGLEGFDFVVFLDSYEAVSDENPIRADEFVTFGAGSYIRVTNEPYGLRPRPIPETGTFALFMAGLVGLSIRRQQKAQR